MCSCFSAKKGKKYAFDNYSYGTRNDRVATLFFEPSGQSPLLRRRSPSEGTGRGLRVSLKKTKSAVVLSELSVVGFLLMQSGCKLHYKIKFLGLTKFKN